MRAPIQFFVHVIVAAVAASAHAAPAGAPFRIPVEVRKLANGLTVVVSEDHSAPTFGISTTYRIGFRLEPRGRTGFAHLFEHMMFEGTPDAPKGIFERVIEGGGGVNNGSTRYDYTDYIASAPVSALDAILWLEADRMKGLDFSEKNLKNQQEVVKEEIRVNVKNRPYGLFFWTDLAGRAFDKWENNHDGYGSFADLDAASLKDVERFFNDYYGPNNAVIAIVGDLSPADVFARVEKYFAALPARPVPPGGDLAESPNPAERTLEETDPLAKVPAIAVGWKVPARTGPDYVPLVRARRRPAERRGVAALPGAREGQGAAAAGRRAGSTSPSRARGARTGPRCSALFGLYKPTSSAKAVADAIQEEVADDRPGRRTRGRPGARQDEDALGLLLRDRAAHRPRRRARDRAAAHGQRGRDQRPPRPDRRRDVRRPAARRRPVPDGRQPHVRRPQARTPRRPPAAPKE